MARKVLHLLAQRPLLTGSGVSLDAVVRCASRAGWDQHVVVGVPREDPRPAVGGLEASRIHPMLFETGSLDFPVPGMSDVMPYRSSRYASLNTRQLAAYREAWRTHIGKVISSFQPDVIHSRHIWLMSSMLKDIAPNTSVVTQCHATGLRQIRLCPHLAEEVCRGCARNDAFFVLHRGHADALADQLRIDPKRIHVVGAGYRDTLFHARNRSRGTGTQIVYAGKYSRAKGLPQLLDAVERLTPCFPDLRLHVAGDGAGSEAEGIRKRMRAMGSRVVMHGQIEQEALADLFRSSNVFVLPSFYEGLPLVLVEAAACGCRLVCTDLPSVRAGLGSAFGRLVNWVPMPRLIGPDTAVDEDLPAFVDRLVATLAGAIESGPIDTPREQVSTILDVFTWDAVFARIETIWQSLADGRD